MESKLKLQRQRGYLLVLAVVLIVVVGAVGVMLAYMFTGNIRSASDIDQSNAALNVAQSALEIANRDINVNGISCANYARSGSVLNGEYSVIGTYTVASSTLTSPISSAATIIPLANAAGFATPRGVVLIGDEKVEYSGISSNHLNLTGAVRGAFNTSANSYASGTAVNQSTCVLTAIGGVPNLTSPNGKRTLQQTMNVQTLYGSGSVDAVVYSYGNTVINGNHIYISNSEASRSGSSPNYTYDGHTIISHGTVTINGNHDATRINIPPNGLTNSSWHGNINGDVIQNYGPSLTTASYFNLFFNPSLYPTYSSLVNAATTISSSSVQITNGSPSAVSFSGGNLAINGNGSASAPLTVTIASTGGILQKWTGNISANGNNIKVVLGGDTDPKVVVVTGGVTLNGNNISMIIGTTNAPVALVTGGNYSENGNNIQSGLSGFIYAKGNITFNGNNPSIGVQGIIASEGAVTYNGNNMQTNLTPSIINSFNEFTGILSTHYTPLDLREMFQ